MSDGGTYYCPVCAKPFDKTDGLADIAISMHGKSHAAHRNGAVNMIRYEENGLMWVCVLCAEPLHPAEFSARLAAVTHCREKHGQVPASSAPVTARDGRRGGERSGLGRVADAVEDAVGAAIDGVGNVLGKLLDP